ncbi:phage tail spike protein [Bacillus cereus group sp. BfR-BA-01119]|uniref:phage tail spike protein n=1 Tax=Bacillus cereus group TaxID=86661 RepID=UPI0022E0E249|nr:MULTISPECIES: phage tail spike protein [Bacillus cereus group]MDA2195260.1 tail fiber domain-containing protein [Bacillus cereus group sp. Bc238]MDA2198833.1 tail fiber domain-containing protein [Bacillus cereus group sp. Bc237]MDA2760640.1 tail fiber domain-containing protein [Bacillus cereus group sp. Bc007]MDA2766330.1 tail fiber domain-containing protein [Bacillus cereus group sp. Bc008]MDA2777466.1 tail fiber domain-containing protein [Bacillus cereus group sp. Bc005]
MRTPSGTLHVVDFKKSQIVSAIQPKDYWDDKRHWEIKNNIDTLEFRVFENTDHAATLVQQNLVLKEVRGGRIVPYVITEAEKDSDDKSLVVYASGEWIQLAKAEIIEPQKIESKTLKQCMEIALKGTKWEIGKTEHDGAHSITIDEFTNPLDLLKKIAASFELEIQYRAEVVGSQIVVRYVDMVKKRGRDTRKEVTVGKDLLGIKRIENSQNICTALLGYVKKDNGEFITISEINNGVPYLVDDAAYQRWNEKGKHKFAFYTPQTENEDMSPQRLMTLMKTEMNKLVNTSVSYEVEAQSIGRVFGLTHELINEGDTIRIIDTGFTPKLYLEARAIAGDESFKDPTQDKYMFGDYREIMDQNDELRRLYQKILSSLYDKVPQELFEQLKDKVNEQNQDIIDAKDKVKQAQKESQEAKDLAEATVEYVEQNLVDIIESTTPPPANLRPNKTLWRDISGGKPGILKIWTGTTWEPVVPDTGPLQQSIKDVQKDIETTKTELNQKVQDAQNQATGQFNEVKESLQSVSRTISDVQNEQGNINKKVTQIEQTSDGFKTSIESLTKKDTEISNKLNTVESTVEGTTKIISDVQQTTNELTKTTSEIREEAGRTKERMEQINSKVDGLEVGATNLIDGTEFINANGWSRWGSYGAISLINESALTSLPTPYSLRMETVVDGKQQVVPNGTQVGMWSHDRKFKVKKGQKYTISFNVATSELGWLLDYVYIMYTAEGGNRRIPDINTLDFPIVAKINDRQNNNYYRVHFTFTADRDDDQAFLLIAGTIKRALDGKNGYAWIRVNALKVEKGTIATDWDTSNADKVSLNEFTKKTTEIEKSVEGITTTVANVKKNQDTMQSTLNQVKQTADSNSQTITSLSQTQGKHGEIIQQNTSDITQLNNQIKSKVSETQMQDYVGGLGSVNMYFNSAFEDRVIDTSTGVVTSRTPSLTKWVTRGVVTGTAVIPTSARNHDGYNSVQIQATGLTANNWAGVYQMIPVTAGQGKMVLSAWVFTNDKASLDAGAILELKFLNGGTTVSQKSMDVRSVVTNGAWTFVSVTADVPTSAITQVQAGIMIVKNGLMWVSQPQVQRGENPTTFMENPKDYANYDQLVGEIAKKVATSDFNSKVTQMETTINQQSNRIDLKAEAKEVYTKTEANGQFGSKAIVESHTSQLSVMSKEINLRVKSGEIASTINQTAQSVLIQASKIYLDGYIEAKHLKAQTLQGVTIQTAPQGSGANHIRLNAQNLTVYGGGRSRGYLGFIERTDGNVQSALILGNDYETTGTLNGSLVIDQTTINSNVFTNSVASIGIATGRNGNDVIKSSYINFYRYDGAMQINSIGDMSLTNTNGNISLTASSTGGTTGFITLSSSKDIYFTAKRGYFNFYTSDNKSFPALIIKDLAPNNQGDVDFMFANQLMLRVARHPDYVGDGIQIKNGTGTSWANMKLGVLRTMGNIGCDANVYAKNFINTSTRKVKTNIKDLPFSALKKVNTVRIKQYNLISDVEKYNAGEIDVLPINYGMIAEDTDGVFTTREKDAVSLYGSVSITMQAVQELDWKTDNMQCDMGMLKQELEAEKLEKVYIENQLNELKILVNSQEDRIANLEELLLQQLINKKPEQP